MPVNDRAGPGEITAPGLTSMTPINAQPHDAGRHQTDNASEPTRQATHIQIVSPGYIGVSPNVAGELYKAPGYAADRIRDHAKRK
jgi:hypothetical protein